MTRLEIMCRTALQWAPIWGSEWALEHVRAAVEGDACGVTRQRGLRLNRRAWLGSQLVHLRELVPTLEKMARKTPPKTLLAEWGKVRAAKARLETARGELARYEVEYETLRRAEHKGTDSKGATEK